MARNMTFSVSLKLLTQGFQKGIKSIQSSLGRLRQQFSTFVGGIGVGLGLQELIENAKSLDKAQATLKNVSGSMERYSENLKFVDDLSKRYNQDLIVLMGNFAKFYSAANYAGMSLKEQQHIYESLTRASAYFNLTADETNGVMLAVQQMISKGKVSSEELRRQLGERLPGAMNLAAKSMGMTTEELDKQIRLGNIYAKDLLPRLATELNALTQNLDINTIQGLTNKVKNEFTEMVEKMDVKGIYKKFLNAVAGGLEYIGNNLRQIGTTIAVVLETIVGKKMLQGGWNAWQNFFKKINSSLSESQAKLKIYKKELDGLGVKYTVNASTGRIGVNPKDNAGVSADDMKAAQTAAKAYNNELRTSAKLQGQLDNKWGTIGKSIGKSVVNMLKFVGMQLIFTAISAALSLIITKTVQWFRKLNEVKRKAKEIKDELETDLNTVTPEQSKTNSMVLTGKENETERARKIEEINRLLGRTEETEFTIKNSNEEINAALQKRMDYLKKVNELEAKNKALAEAESLWKKKAGEATVEQLKQEKVALQAKINADKPSDAMARANPQGYGSAMAYWSASHSKDNQRVSEINQLLDLAKTIEDLRKEIADITTSDAYQNDGSGNNGNNNGGGGGLDGETLEKQYEKIQNEHNNKLRALNERLADNVISQKEYDKAVKDLYFTTLESIYALDGINENTDPFAKAIKDAVKVYLSQVESIEKTEDAIQEYKEKVEAARRQYDYGIITQQELDEKLFDLLKEVVETTSSFGSLNEAAEELANEYKAEKRKKTRKELGEVEAPKLGNYDSLSFYKKSNSEIFEYNAEYLKDYTDQLEEFIEDVKEIGKELSGVDLEMFNGYVEKLDEELINLTAKADSFSEAAKFAEVQEDVKNLKTELAEGIFDNISGIATAAERLTNSWKSLTETMDDPDASGWEKFITIFTTIISTIETIVSVVKAFQAVMAIAEALSLATAAAEQAGIPAKIQDAVATKAQAAAAKELAVAKHMATAASVPYPGNLVAIGTTAGALAAAFAALPAFSEGGIVRGASSVGDRNLIRVNAGEAVLSKMQQANLWNLLNGKTAAFGGGSSIDFRIRGADLVGVINNYGKKISK